MKKINNFFKIHIVFLYKNRKVLTVHMNLPLGYTPVIEDWGYSIYFRLVRILSTLALPKSISSDYVWPTSTAIPYPLFHVILYLTSLTLVLDSPDTHHARMRGVTKRLKTNTSSISLTGRSHVSESRMQRFHRLIEVSVIYWNICTSTQITRWISDIFKLYFIRKIIIHFPNAIKISSW